MISQTQSSPNRQRKKKYQAHEAMIATIAESLVETTLRSFAASSTPVGTERTVVISRAALMASKLKSMDDIKDTLNEHLKQTEDAFTVSRIRAVAASDLNVISFTIIK